jgi:hypothetical protein
MSMLSRSWMAGFNVLMMVETFFVLLSEPLDFAGY